MRQDTTGAVSKQNSQINDLTGIANFFDPTQVINNKYVSYSDGIERASDVFCYYKIPVAASTKYTSNPVGSGDQYAFFNSSNQYLGGAVGATNKTFTTPSTAAYCTYSVRMTEVSTFMVVLGEIIPSIYLPHKALTIASPQSIEKYNLSRAVQLIIGILDGSDNLIVVGKNSGGFSDPQAAINSISNIVRTAIIIDGIFTGSFSCMGKIIDFVGLGPNRSGFVCNNGDYDHPAIMMSPPGSMRHMSLIATHSDNPTMPVSTQKAYALHSDDNYTGELDFFDVYFESYQMAAAGLGFCQDRTVRFRDCIFLSHTDPASDWAHHGALYAHNKSGAAATNQNLFLERCRFISDNNETVFIDDKLTAGSLMDVTAIQNTCYSKALGKTGIIKVITPVASGKFSGNSITLNSMSWGNNVAELNA